MANEGDTLTIVAGHQAFTPLAISQAVYSVTVTLTDAQIKALNSTPIVIVPATETLAYAAKPTTIPYPIRMIAALSKPTGAGYVDAAGGATLKFVLGAMNDGLEYSNQLFSGFLGLTGGGDTTKVKRFVDGNDDILSFADDALADNAIRFGASANNAFTGGNAGNSMNVTVVYFIFDVLA